MARSCGGGRCTSGLEGPSPKGHRKAGDRGRKTGEKGRREVEREQVKSKGRAESRAGRGAPGAARGTGAPTHHFLNDRLGLGGLQLLLHLLFH